MPCEYSSRTLTSTLGPDRNIRVPFISRPCGSELCAGGKDTYKCCFTRLIELTRLQGCETYSIMPSLLTVLDLGSE